LGNSETLAESRITIGDIPGAITMHVVVQPPVAKKKTGLFKKIICPFANAVWLRVLVSWYMNCILVYNNLEI